MHIYSQTRRFSQDRGAFKNILKFLPLARRCPPPARPWKPWLPNIMHDQQRSSPQARSQYQPGSSYPTPAQLQVDESSPHSAPASSPMRLPARTARPTRSSTVGSSHGVDKPQNMPTHATSDQGHTRLPPLTHSPSPGSSSRPNSRSGPSSSPQAYDPAVSGNTVSTAAVSQGANSPAATTMSAQPCSACGLPMSGQFVRALGSVYHLDCFRCRVRDAPTTSQLHGA